MESGTNFPITPLAERQIKAFNEYPLLATMLLFVSLVGVLTFSKPTAHLPDNSLDIR
jgi:hypothetical protein